MKTKRATIALDHVDVKGMAIDFDTLAQHIQTRAREKGYDVKIDDPPVGGSPNRPLVSVLVDDAHSDDELTLAQDELRKIVNESLVHFTNRGQAADKSDRF